MESDKNNLPNLLQDSFLGFFKNFDSFFDESFRHFNTFFNHAFSVNTYETESDVVIESALLGCKRDQIQVEFLRTDQLKISVENATTPEVKNDNNMYYHGQQALQKVERVVTLPYSISEEETAKATFKDGILRIIVPKGKPKRRLVDIE